MPILVLVWLTEIAQHPYRFSDRLRQFTSALRLFSPFASTHFQIFIIIALEAQSKVLSGNSI